MSRPTRAMSIIILALLVLAGCGPASTASSTPPHEASFEATTCPFTVTGGIFKPSDVRCGYLIVPENRQVDNGRTIRVAVAVFKSPLPNPAPDPLVYLIGGPGGTIVKSMGSSISTTGIPTYVGNRDLILVDQRGTGLSRPQLACPEVDTAGWQGLDQRLSETAAAQLVYTALRTCRARLVKAGIDLAAYNTVENAADIADLGPALGYKKVDLQGGSYGSTLALQVMRDHPEGIRSVILEAIADPQFNLYNDFLPSTWNSLQRVFSECAASRSCNTAHPHLRQTFIRAVTRLQAHPLAINIYSKERNRSYPAKLNGAVFVNAMNSAMRSFQTIPLVPEMINEVDAGHGPLLDGARQQPGWSTDPGRVGMFLSMECSQDQSRASSATIAASVKAIPASIRPAFIRALNIMATIDDLTVHANPLTECSLWHVPGLAPVNYTHFHSDIPTLMLPGAFDPNTRPERMPALAAHLGHAYLVPFSAYGHGAVTAGSCPDGIVLAFLTHPQRKPNTGCTANVRMVWQ